MSSEKRVLLAFVLSLTVLMVWQVLVVKRPPPAAQKASPPTGPPAPSTPAAVKAPPAPASIPAQQGSRAEEIVVEGDLYRIVFSTQGAVVRRWVLKKYRDEHQKPLDVVNGPACEALGFPMSLGLADAELTKKLNTALFVANPAAAKLSPPAKVEFVFSDGKVLARKQFSFEPGYMVRVEASVSDGARYLPLEVAWRGGFGDHSLGEKVKQVTARVVYGSPGKLETVAQSDVEILRSIPGPLQTAGLEDRYFVNIFLPESPDPGFRFGPQVWTPRDWKGKAEDRPKLLEALLGTALPKPLAFRLFVAPKDVDVLRSANLDYLVDFGWFSFVAKPLFMALRYIHVHWVHNYGWAIIILTLFISLAMFPLKLKGIRSAQEMQRIAPLVKGIQEKYKHLKFNDPRKQRMNQETMKLYQEHKINPLSGCLPMLFQMPFLIGFYTVLDISIELRHAPWFWWVKDLSAPDPIYVLPVLMTVTMFILQKMTPVPTADPAQQRLMLMMPLVFGIMCFSFASGLVLYWLTSNVVGIAQQTWINRMSVAPPLTSPRKPVGAKP